MGPQNRGVKSENVRASNMSTVLRNILASPGEVTRAGLSQRTGMTRATISRLVDDLVGAGLVRELEPGDGGGRGRPANRLTPRRAAPSPSASKWTSRVSTSCLLTSQEGSSGTDGLSAISPTVRRRRRWRSRPERPTLC